MSRECLVCEFGSIKADRRIGTSADISGFFMTLPTSWRAVCPAACTLGCVSVSTSVNFGTIFGRH
uniref:Uncharacterized protein n=1 Tax=Arundo donax TaxID=35708 RepID=A0A0A9EZH3_ARUDO